MTTEDDFHRALDKNPHDWQTRLVFADWLDERGSPWAAGFRALGLKRVWPCYSRIFRGWVWVESAYAASVDRLLPYFLELTRRTHRLPVSWFAALRQPDRVINYAGLKVWGGVGNRRYADVGAARAFARLPTRIRTLILKGGAR